MAETRWDYFFRRAAEERSRADRTHDPELRAIHLQLAELFDQRGEDCRRSAALDGGSDEVARQTLLSRWFGLE